MVIDAMDAASSLMHQSPFNMSMLEEQFFLNMSSQTIVNLMDKLNENALYWAVKVVLSRQDEENYLWQINCLKKLIHIKRIDKHQSLFSDLGPMALTGFIKEYMKGKNGNAHLYGMICLAIGTGFVLPDELIRLLVLTHQLNHWIPLLTEEQRKTCFEELLRNADNDKKYLNLMQFISPDAEQTQYEVKAIVKDLFKKFPLFSSNEGKYHEHLTVLNVLSGLILRLDKKRYQEVLAILLPKLNVPNAKIREATLNILAACIPYLNQMTRDLVLNPIRAKLNDKEPNVRLAAQKAVTSCLPYFENYELNEFNDIDSFSIESLDLIITYMSCHDDQKQKELSDCILQKLKDSTWIVSEDALKIIKVCLPLLSEESRQEIISNILTKLNTDNSKTYRAILKMIMVAQPYLNGAHCLEFLNSILPNTNSNNWSVRELALRALGSCMPHVLDGRKRQEVFDTIFPLLNDSNWIVRDAVLHAMSLILPYLKEENHQQVLTSIIPNLSDQDWSNRYVVLQALLLFLPHLNQKFHKPVLEKVLPCLKDTNSIVRGMAMQVLSFLIPEISNKKHQQLIDAIFLQLNDENSYVCAMARKAITKLIPFLNEEQHQLVMSVLLLNLNGEVNSIREAAALQDIVVCVPFLNHKSIQQLFETILPKLSDSEWSVSCAAAQTLTACIPYMNDHERAKVLQVVLPKLNDESWELCEEILKIILTCSLHLPGASINSLGEQLAMHFRENSLANWCEEMGDRLAH